MYTKDDNTNVTKPAPDASSGKNFENPERSGRAFAGIIVVIAGALLLAERAGAEIPDFLFRWPMILVVVGLYVGIKHKFKNWAWMVPFGIGVAFTASYAIDDFNISAYIWPIVIIGIGLVLIIKPKRDKSWDNWAQQTSSSEDVMDSVAIFGAVKKNIISKDFKGGESVAVFGGGEINFSQADINGRVVLEITNVFAGTKLVMPPNWRLQTDEMVCIFGGMDDKRRIINADTDPNKILVLRGTCVFGGIDIKSY